MRLGSQIAVLALVGGAAALGWSQWTRVAPVLAQVPGFGFLAAKPSTGSRQGQPGGGGPVLVEVATLATGAIVETTEAVGTIRAYESVALTAKVSGIVDRISFEEGQSVKAGDELVRLDVAERRADLEAARAAIATARAKREETMQKLQRALALRQTGAGTEAQVADLTAQVKTAETDVVAAEARERSAAARLDDLILRAPFEGRVGLRQVSLGAAVDSKVTITTLDDISRMRLDFAVPETLIARIAVGSPVAAESVAFPGRAFSGTVSVIDTRIDTVTRAARVTAVIPNPDQALKPGMFMTVRLRVATRENAVLAPEEAIVAEGPRQIAFRVRDGRVERRVVTIGQRQDGKVEILDGLAAGDVIVVRGVQRVRQGVPVQTRPAFGPPGSAPAAGSVPPPGPDRKA
ncbi:efflux RND transporter periplasmic adaptor subunit [Rhabdaerophilum calidifontis]|uniref:efflux RND transporter periplasmic adaptor subunit n=1 Tax=Rhabdaerophilum calidifontis TaxID=2604328 RepID=UPI00123B1708|nr:efflux RND transporter periplasmic adaptor subunit [Rhabdaerophilum calidifontis]